MPLNSKFVNAPGACSCVVLGHRHMFMCAVETYSCVVCAKVCVF